MSSTENPLPFLQREENSVTREKLYFHKFALDLHFAAATKGYPLQILPPDVDRYGFDVVLNDQDFERHIQTKTFLPDSTTDDWSIRKGFLRPSMSFVSLETAGLGGGIVVIQILPSCSEVVYHYADYLTLLAMKEKLVKGHKSSVATRILKRLLKGSARDEVTLAFGVFLRAKTVNGLLGLMGLHNSLESSVLPNLFHDLQSAPESSTQAFAKTQGVMRERISAVFSALVELLDMPEMALWRPLRVVI